MIDPASYTANTWGGETARTSGYMPVFGEKKGSQHSANAPASFHAALTDTDNAHALQDTAQTANSAQSNDHHPFLSFLKAILDVVNPLQHIPVVGAIYRHMTGDEISPMARVAGDALFGGPIGAALGMADVALEKTTGKDLGETTIALVTGGKSKPTDEAPVLTATASPIMPSSASEDKDIIWNDEKQKITPAPTQSETLALNQQNFKVFPLIRTSAPQTSGAGLGEKAPDVPSTPQVLSLPVHVTKGEGTKAVPTAAPNPILQPQAPVENARMQISPELSAVSQQNIPPAPPSKEIAAKMMEALDKYKAMQSLSGSSAAF